MGINNFNKRGVSTVDLRGDLALPENNGTIFLPVERVIIITPGSF